jgi:hypothetical protein
MQPTNRAIVQRTFGLLELQALNGTVHLPPLLHLAYVTDKDQSNSLANAANRQRYGSTFAYDEFIAMPSKTLAFVFTAVSIIGLTMMMYFAPVSPPLKLCNPRSTECVGPLGTEKNHFKCGRRTF